MREDLPASVASNVVMIVTPKMGAAETFDADRSTTAARAGSPTGNPLAGGDVMVKLTYSLRGEPFEIEIPFVSPDGHAAILIEMKAVQDVRADRRDAPGPRSR